ncbi:MAG: hypothetical protein SPK36_01385 [Bacilli bacterium]|nr:hypothetical protein [Bacilli bacterium]
MAKFNRENVLRQLQFKRKWRSYSRYVYIAVPCVLCCLLCLYFAYSKFFVSEEQAVIRTTVGAYIDGEYSSTIPGKNDGYVVENVACDNGAVGKWNSADWGLLTTNLSKRTKCNVYFKKLVTKVPDIIAQLDTSGKCPTVNDDGSVSVTAVEDTNCYLCKAKDAYGDSYYYRGNVTNNYVKFADKYWRIVRINGDGTVRVIYDGTSAHANGESSEDRQIGTSAFNSSYKDNAYVGYMYGATGASTYAAAHANTNDSTIKAYIDNWYNTNIVGTTNEQYLADNIFCNDRSISSNKPSSSYNNLGYGTNATAYRWYYFANSSYNNKMMLTCPQQNDAFTVSDTTKGNGALTYPVGLLSTDEIVLAGGWNASNRGYYLYSGGIWWASSPCRFNGSDALVRRVYSDGNPNYFIRVNNSYGVRPVFNLKAEVLAQGSGTATDPYRISS